MSCPPAASPPDDLGIVASESAHSPMVASIGSSHSLDRGGGSNADAAPADVVSSAPFELTETADKAPTTTGAELGSGLRHCSGIARTLLRHCSGIAQTLLGQGGAGPGLPVI